MIEEHLKSIGNALNELRLRYENFILIGDFNSEITEETTCFKNSDNPSCIDLRSL